MNKRHAKPILALVVSLLVGTGGYLYTQISSAVTAQSTIRVATYNLRSQRWDGQNPNYNSWASRKNSVKSVILSNAKPGIIGMQEVIKRNPDTNQYVSQRNDVINFMVPSGYGYFVGSVNNSSPIFWKADNFEKLKAADYLIFDPKTSTISGDTPAARYLSFARLRHKQSRKPLLVFNYHFNQFERRSEQLTSLTSVIRSIRNTYPNDKIIFTGDFNNYHKNIITKLAAKNISLRLADANPRVDHVLISNAISKNSWFAVAPGSPPASDHYLVLARIGI